MRVQVMASLHYTTEVLDTSRRRGSVSQTDTSLPLEVAEKAGILVKLGYELVRYQMIGKGFDVLVISRIGHGLPDNVLATKAVLDVDSEYGVNDHIAAMIEAIDTDALAVDLASNVIGFRVVS